MLWLLCSGVKDTLPTVNLHAHVQLKVDVSFSCRAAEAAPSRCARPALAEQLTHSRKPRGLPVRCLAEVKQGGGGVGRDLWKLLCFIYWRENTLKEKMNGAAFHLTFITQECLRRQNKAKQQLTKAFCSWAVSRAQTRPPFRSLRRRKRRGRRASCRRAGREVRVRRQQGWQEHWKPSGGPQQRMENGDDGDDEGGMAHRHWRTTGPPLPPQETSENDRETNSHRVTDFMSGVERSTWKLNSEGESVLLLGCNNHKVFPLRYDTRWYQISPSPTTEHDQPVQSVHAVWGGIKETQQGEDEDGGALRHPIRWKEKNTRKKMTMIKCQSLDP